MMGLILNCESMKNLTIIEDVYITRLFAEGTEIQGAVDAASRTGEMLVFETPSVILGWEAAEVYGNQHARPTN